MTKISTLLVSLLSLSAYGQHFCGFDEHQREIEQKYPKIKEERVLMDRKFRTQGALGVLRELNIIPENELGRFKAMSSSYQGEIYEIPVVVHILETDTDAKLTDEQIITWIDKTNKIFATTYGNGYFPEGNTINDGAVIPFKLVLAKRGPKCGETTTGIVRYDASNVPGYKEYGMARKGGQGAKEEDLKNIAPHWPEDSYYNIYLITGFNGNKRNSGLLGYANYPNTPNSIFEAVMKMPVVTSKDESTLAHEFGHSLGLYHPFINGNDDNGNNCPKNDNPDIDNDGVRDTEPTKSLLNPTPTNNDINPCTNQNFQGVQYNIMHYTSEPRKFTSGQRDRALALFLSQKGELTKSKAAKELSPTRGESLDMTPAYCSPTSSDDPNNTSRMGIKRVQLENIDYISEAHGRDFYKDLTLRSCLKGNVYTDIPDDKEDATIMVEGGGLNTQRISVWIDYNNDGIFDVNERIGYEIVSKTNKLIVKLDKNKIQVKNTYLRMRVRGDRRNTRGACDNMERGKTEDYAVRFVTKDFVDNKNPTTSTGGVYTGRVGINTEQPQATLDIREIEPNLLPVGAAQGVVFPNFTTEQRAKFQNVKEGTMIYNTTLKCVEFYDGMNWKCLN